MREMSVGFFRAVLEGSDSGKLLILHADCNSSAGCLFCSWEDVTVTKYVSAI